MPNPKREELLKKYGKKPVQTTQPTEPQTPPADEVTTPATETEPQVVQPDDVRARLASKYKITKKPTTPQEKPAVDVEVSYTSEQEIETGTYTALPDIEDVEYDGIDLSALRSMYSTNGGKACEVDKYIIDYLNSIKGNDDALRNFMSTFFSGLKSDFFDSSKTTCDFGDDTEVILSRVLSQPEGEVIPGWVCSNIHDLGMRYMHKCGMEAAIVSCKQNMGAGHAILIYKNGDGKYTFFNYGHADQVEADNMVDAVCQLQKSNPSLMSNGTICFVDEKGSYCKYALEDDAVWGEKIDKSARNGEMPTSNILPKKTDFSVQLNTTNLNDKSATLEGALLLGKHKRTAITGGIGYQTNSNSQIFNTSEAFGATLGLKTVSGGNHTKTYFGVDAIVDYTQANYQPIPTEDGGERQQGAEYLTTFARGAAGIENNIDLSAHTTLTNTTQASAEGYLVAGITLGTSYNGDGRLAVEDGLKLTHKSGDVTLENALSGGLLVDLRKTSGAQEFSTQLGTKFNASTSILVNPSGNVSYGIGADGYSVFTPTTTDYGIGAKTFITYKPDGSDITFGGNLGARYDHQDLSIGGINENIKNDTSFYASVSAKHKKNTFTVGYNGKFDGINNSRNNSTVMVRYTRTF